MSVSHNKDNTKNTKNSTIDFNELKKFEIIANEWWDELGKFKPLHILNPVRIKFIKDISVEHFKINNNSKNVFKGLKILDIGCGGGLLSEPIRRLGAKVTAIDASQKNINVATSHAKNSGLSIDYQCITVEELSKTNEKFDIILNMEVVEHVANVENFINSSSELLKDEGIMFTATLNRTVKSYLFAIIGAEYILKWLPKNTHDWKRFLKPSELNSYLANSGAKLKLLQGVSYNPLTSGWYLSKDVDINYIMVSVKSK